MNQEPAVFLVDDDDGMRQSLEFILATVGGLVVSFSSPAELLAVYEVDRPGCLVLDLQLPQMNGLELWGELRLRGGSHPCIIISGHGTILDMDDTHVTFRWKDRDSDTWRTVRFSDQPPHQFRLHAPHSRDAALRPRDFSHWRCNDKSLVCLAGWGKRCVCSLSCTDLEAFHFLRPGKSPKLPDVPSDRSIRRVRHDRPNQNVRGLSST